MCKTSGSYLRKISLQEEYFFVKKVPFRGTLFQLNPYVSLVSSLFTCESQLFGLMLYHYMTDKHLKIIWTVFNFYKIKIPSLRNLTNHHSLLILTNLTKTQNVRLMHVLFNFWRNPKQKKLSWLQQINWIKLISATMILLIIYILILCNVPILLLD